MLREVALSSHRRWHYFTREKQSRPAMSFLFWASCGVYRFQSMHILLLNIWSHSLNWTRYSLFQGSRLSSRCTDLMCLCRCPSRNFQWTPSCNTYTLSAEALIIPPKEMCSTVCYLAAAFDQDMSLERSVFWFHQVEDVTYLESILSWKFLIAICAGKFLNS